MDTDSFLIYIKTEDFHEGIANDIEKWFDASNYNKNDKRPLPIVINKKLISMFKDELGGKIMIKFSALRAKTYAYLIDNYDDDDYGKNKIMNKKAKSTKKCVTKRDLMFKNYKGSLFENKTILKSQHRFRSDHHRVYTEEVNKIALSSNDNKRIQTYDKTTTYPYRNNACIVWESEMLARKKVIPIE